MTAINDALTATAAERAEHELDVLDERMAIDGDFLEIIHHPTRFLGFEPVEPPWVTPTIYRIRIQGLSGDMPFTGLYADVVEKALLALRELDAHGAGPPSARIKPAGHATGCSALLGGGCTCGRKV